MNQLINLSGDYVTFDVGEKKKQKVKIVGTFKQPYFCGKDVCEILGYENIQQALYLHVKSKHKKELKLLNEELQLEINCNSFGSSHLKNITYHSGKAVYVNEPGLYSLIMKSKAPFAEAFQDLVYEVILPSIRQHGTYSLEKEFEEKLNLKDQALVKAEQKAIKSDFEKKEAEQKAIKSDFEKKEAEQKAIKSDFEKDEAVQKQHQANREKDQAEQKQHQANLEKDEALKQRRIAEFRALTLNKLCVNYSERVKTQVFYIVTSKAFSKDNEFKIGGVDSVAQLKKRLSVYNSGNSGVHPELNMYFVFLIEVANYKQMESRMKELLVPFRSKRNANTENFNIHFDILKPLTELVADHYNEEIEKLNDFLKMLLETHTEQYMSSGELEAVDPESMPSHLNMEVVVTKRKFGEVKGKKIKISDLNQEELKQVIEQVLETKWGSTGKGTPVRRSELEQILEATFIIASHKRRVWDVAKVSIEEAGKTPRY